MTAATARAHNPDFACAVSDGLFARPKTLPASWLYDELGSALFEAITLLPEYGLTRADAGLLERSSPEIIAAAGRPSMVAELGSGTGSKTRHLLSAAVEHGDVRYLPIDISPAALENCERALSGMNGVSIQPVESTYFEGLDDALSLRRPEEPVLVLFLGSTIGNFDPAERDAFLRRIRRSLRAGDSLLLGTDLVKRREVLLQAYDDALGVTAAFNRNILCRINRELGGAFDLSRFVHEARYNERHLRIEMHLRSLDTQDVWVEALQRTISFTAGETIWTESCYKFRAAQVLSIGELTGWRNAAQWIDDGWGFAETLFTA